VIAAVTAAALLIAAVHWFKYYRVATYMLRRTTGAEASFSSAGPDVDKDGNAKVLLLLPGEQSRCYIVSYSKDFLGYLRKQNKSTVSVTLRLIYSYGSIYSFEIIKLGDYVYNKRLIDHFEHTREGNCVKQLDKYAELPGPGERHD
jgi:hypothetical protein